MINEIREKLNVFDNFVGKYKNYELDIYINIFSTKLLITLSNDSGISKQYMERKNLMNFNELELINFLDNMLKKFIKFNEFYPTIYEV